MGFASSCGNMGRGRKCRGLEWQGLGGVKGRCRCLEACGQLESKNRETRGDIVSLAQ